MYARAARIIFAKKKLKTLQKNSSNLVGRPTGAGCSNGGEAKWALTL